MKNLTLTYFYNEFEVNYLRYIKKMAAVSGYSKETYSFITIAGAYQSFVLKTCGEFYIDSLQKDEASLAQNYYSDLKLSINHDDLPRLELLVEVAYKLKKYLNDDHFFFLLEYFINTLQTQGVNMEGNFRITFMLEKILDCVEYLNDKAIVLMNNLINLQGTTDWYNMVYPCIPKLMAIMPIDNKNALIILKKGLSLNDGVGLSEEFEKFIKNNYINEGLVDNDLNWLE